MDYNSLPSTKIRLFSYFRLVLSFIIFIFALSSIVYSLYMVNDLSEREIKVNKEVTQLKNKISKLESEISSLKIKQNTNSKILQTQEKGDFLKVVISGKSFSKSNFHYTISGTVKNNDKIKHSFYVKAIYYDKNKTPIFTKESNVIVLNQNEIKGFFIELYDSAIVENIDNYELKIFQSKSVLGW